MNTQYGGKRHKSLLKDTWTLFLLCCWATLFFGGMVGIIIAILIMLGVLLKMRN